MTISRFEGCVPFPLAGEGAVLRFRTRDLVKIEEDFGLNWFEVVPERLDKNSYATLVAVMKAGLKSQDGVTPFLQIDHDDYPFSLQQATPAISDAFACALSGMTYRAVLDAKAAAAEAARANPPLSPEEAEALQSVLLTPRREPGSP